MTYTYEMLGWNLLVWYTDFKFFKGKKLAHLTWKTAIFYSTEEFLDACSMLYNINKTFNGVVMLKFPSYAINIYIYVYIIAFWLDINHYWEQEKGENGDKKLALAEVHGNRSSLKTRVLKKEHCLQKTDWNSTSSIQQLCNLPNPWVFLNRKVRQYHLPH